MKTLTRALAIAMTLLIVTSISVYLWKRDAISFALLSPAQKFEQAWRNDIHLLESSKTLPAQWNEIGSIEIRSEPSPARDWLEHVKAPVSIKKGARYKLQLFAIHFIEENRYGAILDYWLIDTQSGNTIWETARTLKLGYVY